MYVKCMRELRAAMFAWYLIIIQSLTSIYECQALVGFPYFVSCPLIVYTLESAVYSLQKFPIKSLCHAHLNDMGKQLASLPPWAVEWWYITTKYHGVLRGSRKPDIVAIAECIAWEIRHFEGILPKGPYLPCVSMAGRALLAGYHRFMMHYTAIQVMSWGWNYTLWLLTCYMMTNLALAFTIIFCISKICEHNTSRN